VVPVEVEVESDRMRAPVGGHEGWAGGKEENDEMSQEAGRSGAKGDQGGGVRSGD
jgi:hypothetical protein